MKLFIIFLLLSARVFSQNNESIFRNESPFSFEKTVQLLEAKFREKKLRIFAKINHSQAAKQVKEPLSPTLLLVVGNPKVGTLLMQENREMAIHLPLKILISEENKKIFVSFQKISILSEKLPNENSKQITQKIDNSVINIITEVLKTE